MVACSFADYVFLKFQEAIRNQELSKKQFLCYTYDWVKQHYSEGSSKKLKTPRKKQKAHLKYVIPCHLTWKKGEKPFTDKLFSGKKCRYTEKFFINVKFRPFLQKLPLLSDHWKGSTCWVVLYRQTGIKMVLHLISFKD